MTTPKKQIPMSIGFVDPFFAAKGSFQNYKNHSCRMSVSSDFVSIMYLITRQNICSLKYHLLNLTDDLSCTISTIGYLIKRISAKRRSVQKLMKNNTRFIFQVVGFGIQAVMCTHSA